MVSHFHSNMKCVNKQQSNQGSGNAEQGNKSIKNGFKFQTLFLIYTPSRQKMLIKNSQGNGAQRGKRNPNEIPLKIPFLQLIYTCWTETHYKFTIPQFFSSNFFPFSLSENMDPMRGSKVNKRQKTIRSEIIQCRPSWFQNMVNYHIYKLPSLINLSQC